MPIRLPMFGSLLLLVLAATSCTAPYEARDGDGESEEVSTSESAFSTGFGLPFPAGAAYRITQGPQGNFSHAPPYNTYAIDFAMPIGAPVVASGAGRVVFEGWFNGEIKAIIDHGGNRCTLYTHLNRTIINVGQWVRRGEHIGDSGATGRVTAAHLHWDMINCNNWTSREIVPTDERGTSYPVGAVVQSTNSLR
jgi:murein DD-endopeptidase MepM/ murein hydrolase activator NlpD